MTVWKFFHWNFRQPAPPDRIETDPNLSPDEAILAYDLLALAHTLQPDPAFVTRLEGQLTRARLSTKRTSARISLVDRTPSVIRTAWGWVLPAAGMILFIIIISLLLQMRPHRTASIGGGTPTPVPTMMNSIVQGEPMPFEVCGESTTWTRPSEGEQKAKWWDNARYAGAGDEVNQYPWTHDFLVAYAHEVDYDLINLSGLWTLAGDVRAKCFELTAQDAILKLQKAEVWALLHRVKRISRVGSDYYIVVEPAAQGVQFIQFARPEQQIPLTMHFVTEDGQELEKIVEAKSPYWPYPQLVGTANHTPIPTAAVTVLPPTSVPLVATPASTEEALLAELQNLAAKRAADLLASPGWLYLHLRRDNTANCGSLLPNGAFNPCEIEEHDWYELNAQGGIVTAITRQLGPSGNVFQETVARGGVTRNLTFGYENTATLTTTYETDWGFAVEAAQAVAQGVTLRQEDRSLDGKYEGQFALLLIDGDMFREAVFNRQTDGLLSLSTWKQEKDGLTQVESISLLEEGRVDQPPAEALALLDRPTPPYQPLPPQGDPIPAGFDLAYSTLSMRNIAGDAFNAPTFWYGDLYADGAYLVGRVDFGATPGGFCQRSPDGIKLAFDHVTLSAQEPANHQLRWLDLANPAQVKVGPDGLQLVSLPMWGPNSTRLAFIACDAAQSCGLYTYVIHSGALTRLADGGNAIPPVWSLGGEEIAFRAGPSAAPQTVVVDAATGKVIALPSWQPQFLDLKDVSVLNQCTQPPALAPTRSPAPPDWLVYANTKYGFTFRYPPGWTLEESSNSILLKRGTLQITIGFRNLKEQVSITRTGVAAGDILPAGHVSFFGLSLSRDLLVYQGKDKAILYGMATETKRGEVVFTLSLDDFNLENEAVNLTVETQRQVDQVIESFSWIQP